MNSWEFEVAERTLGDVLDAAIRNGPQRIESHGMPVAVVLSYDDYRRLVARQSKLASLFGPDGHGSISALATGD